MTFMYTGAYQNVYKLKWNFTRFYWYPIPIFLLSCTDQDFKKSVQDLKTFGDHLPTAKMKMV